MNQQNIVRIVWKYSGETLYDFNSPFIASRCFWQHYFDSSDVILSMELILTGKSMVNVVMNTETQRFEQVKQ